MNVTQIRIAFWCGILLCAALIVAAATRAFDPGISMALLLSGGGGIVVAFVVRSVAVERALRIQAQRDAQRVLELQRQVQSLGMPVEVRGASGIGIFAILFLIAALLTVALIRRPEARAVLLVVPLWLTAILGLLVALPFLGKPLLRITHTGLETPAHGKLTWSEIDGLDMTEVRAKGASVGHLLHLLVSGLPRRLDQMHPATRLLHKIPGFGRGRTQVRLRLAGTSESPQVIHRLCIALWSQQTKKRPLWSSGMSEKTLADLRDGEYRLAELERAGELAQTDSAAAMRILDELEKNHPPPADPKVARQMARYKAETDEVFAKHDRATAMKIINERNQERRRELEERRRQLEERRAKMHRTHWATWLALAIIVLLVAARVATLVAK